VAALVVWYRLAVDAIIRDLSGRRGLKWEWDKVDDDIREEIAQEWTHIIADHAPRAPASQPSDTGNTCGEGDAEYVAARLAPREDLTPATRADLDALAERVGEHEKDSADFAKSQVRTVNDHHRRIDALERAHDKLIVRVERLEEDA
jgi:hypothetical protein